MAQGSKNSILGITCNEDWFKTLKRIKQNTVGSGKCIYVKL